MNPTSDTPKRVRLDLYPQSPNCLSCQQPLKERYRKRRWVVQLHQRVEVVSHCWQCDNRECPRYGQIERPEQEGALALRGYQFGLDVIAQIGQWRYREGKTLQQIQQQLAPQVSISYKEVALLCEVYLALVNTVVQSESTLMAQLNQLGNIVLSIDGIQPEKGNETLYLLREVRLGRVLVAKNLASSATTEIEKLIAEVQALGLPIVGVISDKQQSIVRAVERQLPGVPHQLCQYHYLRDLAQPVCEADRRLGKQLRQQVRRLRPIERLAEAQVDTAEAQVVGAYSLTIRQVMGQSGHYPLDPPGIKLFEQLQQIEQSLERALAGHDCPLLRRLINRLAFIEQYQARFTQVQSGFKIIHGIARLLETRSDEAVARERLVKYVEQKMKQYQQADDTDLQRWSEHFHKITTAFADKLFTYRRQPLLPSTNNALESFIGQLKKTRRHVTGRKNVQSFILREGAAVAIFISLSISIDWLESFAHANYDMFCQVLKTLRRSHLRSQAWQIRHHFNTHLLGLEQQWQAIE